MGQQNDIPVRKTVALIEEFGGVLNLQDTKVASKSIIGSPVSLQLFLEGI